MPYSKFPVGACLVAKNGTIYQGINIENASYGLTNCAERTAFFKAVSEGEKVSTFGCGGSYARTDLSCGACRQVMVEFCAPDMPVTLVGDDGVIKETTVEGLLPYYFTNKDL